MARRKWNFDTIEQVLKGEQPFIQVGYTKKPKKKQKRKEGECWIDAKGNRWKRKDGVDVSDTPLLDAINELSKCSVCGMNVRNYGNRLDKKVFPKTSKCYDCLEAEEMIYRATGKWDEYQRITILKNHRSALKDFREKVLESIHFIQNETGKIRETMADGTELTFTGKCNPEWLVDAQSDLVKVNEELQKIDKEIEDFESSMKQYVK